MPYVRNRNKLEKQGINTGRYGVPDSPDDKVYCFRCGLAYNGRKNNFIVSHSPMYRKVGYLPWCNKCVDEMYNSYRAKLGDIAAMRRMCMKLDLFWDYSIYQMVEKDTTETSRIKLYIKRANIVRYVNKSFDDTLEVEAAANILPDIDGLPEEKSKEDSADNGDSFTVTDEMRLYWGQGYPARTYKDLEDRLEYWKKQYPKGYKLEGGEEALIKQICGLEVDINRDRAAGAPVKDNVSLLNTLLGSAMLKPSQKTESADSAMEKNPMGVWIKRWEEKRPIPEVDPEFKDVDGIVRYIDVWMKGHLAKMLGIKNGYSALYEKEIANLRVERPEFNDEDDESFFADVFEAEDGDEDGDS